MYTNNTTNILGLQQLIITDIQESQTNITISAKTAPTPQTCPCCGKPTTYIHGYRRQVVKDLPMRLKTVQIILSKRRYICKACNKTFFEKYSFLPKYRQFTNRTFMGILQTLSSSRSLKSIAQEFSCSSTTVLRVLKLVATMPKSRLPKYLGIDEFKGNTNKEKYQCILTNLEDGSVFDILPTRKKSHLISYFKRFNNRNEVKFFVMDMTNNYKDLSFLFPNATVIADRFHYIRQVYWALDNVRKRVQKSFQKNKRLYFKHSKKLLYADINDLNDENRQALITMISQDHELWEAWMLKENFKYFRKATTKETAEQELHIWLTQAEESGLQEFKNAITAFRNWRNPILNSVAYKFSNGITEGFNNKIKVLKRNAYGYRNFYNFRARILLNCSKNSG